MGKKAKTAGPEVVAVIGGNICQNCKTHKNRPSFCTANKKYVGRKSTACEKFVSK